ncbi:MAG: uracil-DNA glycosylase 2 [Bacteroidota bacterium]
MEFIHEKSWADALQAETSKSYFQQLSKFIETEYSNQQIYPPRNQVFRAFELCPLSQVKVVILGQDPYHKQGQANGLSFSVNRGIRIPPSLRNIFQEIAADLANPIEQDPDLERWAQQGVLLLNATLTVREQHAGSHQNKGWEQFTDAVISELNTHTNSIVFILWGAYAQKKGALINRQKHLVLESVHPSPLSAHRGFFGNHHFSLTNQHLQSSGINPINW